jgi:hypothetical protein
MISIASFCFSSFGPLHFESETSFPPRQLNASVGSGANKDFPPGQGWNAPVLGRRGPVAVVGPSVQSPIMQDAGCQRLRGAGHVFLEGRVSVIVRERLDRLSGIQSVSSTTIHLLDAN